MDLVNTIRQLASINLPTGFVLLYLPEPLVEYQLLKSQGGDDERVDGSTNRDD